jgi:hypothetical protein
MAKLQGGTTVYGLLSTYGVVYADGGNSDQWNSANTAVAAASSSWNNKLGLTGGTLTGSLSGTIATFSTSVSAPSLSGVHFGDGSRLTNVLGTDSSKLPLSGGSLTGSLIVAAGTSTSVPLLLQTGTITSSPTANAVEWDGTQLYVTSSNFNRRELSYIDETVTIFSSNPASFATNIFYTDTQEIHFYTLSATSNFVVDVSGNNTTSYNNAAAVNSTRTICIINTSGSTAYAPTLRIDGATQTVKWQGGQSTGNPDALDVWTFTIIKTAATTYAVLGSIAMYS